MADVSRFQVDTVSRNEPKLITVLPRPGLDPRALRDASPLRRIPGRNLSKADVVVYRVHGADVAVKDYGSRPFVVRNSIGRFFIRRESAAYRAAAGVAGLPPFLGRVGPFALATAWIDASPLSSFSGRTIDPKVFDRLSAILETMHQRGIALSDLHHRDVLVGGDGTVHLVDLATAWIADGFPAPLRRAVFRTLRDMDRVALARMRARFTGTDEALAVRDSVGSASATRYRLGRRIKQLWDRLRGRLRVARD